jgi:hypothetical protein
MSPNPPPQEPVVTDEELKEAIGHWCNTHSPPVAKTEHIASLDTIDIKQTTVARRLQKLSEDDRDPVRGMDVGTGWVWWLSEEDTVHEYDSINWKQLEVEWSEIDVEEIPEDMIKDHPEYPDYNRWEKLSLDGGAIARYASYVFLVGLAVYLIQQAGVPVVTLGQNVEAVGLLSIISGATFIVVGFALNVIASLGERFEERDGQIPVDIFDF